MISLFSFLKICYNKVRLLNQIFADSNIYEKDTKIIDFSPICRPDF